MCSIQHVWDNIPGKELYRLVPGFGIWIAVISEDNKEEERLKIVELVFVVKWRLEVKFLIEKKKVNDNLKDHAAESVVKNIMIEEEIEELVIPCFKLSEKSFVMLNGFEVSGGPKTRVQKTHNSSYEPTLVIWECPTFCSHFRHLLAVYSSDYPINK